MKKLFFTLTMLLFSVVLFSQVSRSTVLDYWKQRVVPPYAQDSTTWASFWNMADDGYPLVYPDSVANSVASLDTIVIKDTNGVFRKATVGQISGGGQFLHYVGEQAEGGIIFYLWLDSLGQEHGLVYADTTFGTIAWSNITSGLVSAGSNWNGEGNTTNIGLASSSGAGDVCYNLIYKGYSDWYLGSILEVKQLVQNFYLIAKATNYPLTGVLWTSTENDATTAYSFTPINNTITYNTNKVSTLLFFAIRQF